MDINYSRLPSEIPFPSFVIRSGVFSGAEGDLHKYGRSFGWSDGDTNHAMVVIGGGTFTPKHLKVWKTLYTQRRLCEASCGTSGYRFLINESDLMDLLGVEPGDHLGKAKMFRVLADLACIQLESTTPMKGRLSGWSSENIISMGGHRDSVRKPWWYSFHVGPKFRSDDWPAMPFDMVQVSNEDIESLKHWVAVPLPSYGEAGEEEQPEEIKSTRKAKNPPRTPGYVYILTNPAMPGLIKIGKTRLNPEDRANQLQTTGVPRGFQVEYACHTPDPEAVEQAMHVAFGPRRVNDRREFFEITPDQAIAVLSLHHQAEPSTTIQ